MMKAALQQQLREFIKEEKKGVKAYERFLRKIDRFPLLGEYRRILIEIDRDEHDHIEMLTDLLNYTRTYEDE